MRNEISPNQHRGWFPEAEACSFRQSYGRATVRSGRAMLDAMARSRLVAIDLETGVDDRHGDEACLCAQIAVRAGVEAQR